MSKIGRYAMLLEALSQSTSDIVKTNAGQIASNMSRMPIPELTL